MYHDVRTAFHIVDKQPFFNRHKPRRILLAVYQIGDKILAHPLLRRETDVFFSYAVEDIRSFFTTFDAVGIMRQIEPWQ